MTIKYKGYEIVQYNYGDIAIYKDNKLQFHSIYHDQLTENELVEYFNKVKEILIRLDSIILN